MKLPKPFIYTRKGNHLGGPPVSTLRLILFLFTIVNSELFRENPRIVLIFSAAPRTPIGGW